MRLVRGALVAAALGVMALPAAGGDGNAQTRKTMDQIFEAMKVLLPLSLDEERFEDPSLRPEIQAALDVLAENGKQLEAHGQTRDAGFAYLSRSLARDSRDIKRRFDEGKFTEASFLLRALTETCVACHSRLPSDRRFPLGERFVEKSVVAALPLDERARYEMATRQFDRALDTEEELFEAPDTVPADLSLMGYVDDYLEISLRVKGNFDRPLAAFEKLSKRDDLSPVMREELDHWIRSLRELKARKPLPTPVAEARALIRAAEDKSRFPDRRDALVYYIAASGVLQRYVDAQHDPSRTLAEAYYLLGIIEARVGRSLWLSQSEVFLETSIRMAPHAPFAPDALALLEDVVVSGYTGSAGTHVPEDVQTHLDELRALVKGS